MTLQTRTPRRRAAFTLVEVMIVVGLMGIILGVFANLYLKSVRDSQRQLLFMRSHGDAMKVLDRLRPILMPARFNSVVIANNGHQITFLNPWNDPAGRSRLEFGEWDGRDCLLYAENIDTGDQLQPMTAFPLEDMTFSLLDSDSIIEVNITTPATMRASDRRPFTITTHFRVRNFQ
jgi:prepilin-type N-terminal cleavage/methylation domain-containing protein